jgi:hypothetical protein
MCLSVIYMHLLSEHKLYVRVCIYIYVKMHIKVFWENGPGPVICSWFGSGGGGHYRETKLHMRLDPHKISSSTSQWLSQG